MVVNLDRKTLHKTLIDCQNYLCQTGYLESVCLKGILARVIGALIEL